MKLTSRVRAAASAALSILKGLPTLSGVDGNRGWFSLFRSNKDLNWQSDKKVSQDAILAFAPVYSCMTLIASDIGKICLRLMDLEDGIWVETTNPAFSPLLRKPNHFQTRQQFIETWVLSKLTHGNTIALKIRDNRNIVTALYILDWNRVTPLVAPDGSIYYQVMRDDLSKLPADQPAIPASEIIHDRMECLFHPLIGISPLTAAYLPASQGMRIQQNSDTFFKNMSRPSGFLTAPGAIDDETANRLKKSWEDNYSGGNVGRMAVLGNDLKYMGMTVNPNDAQMVEQLKLSGEQICSAFHVPPYMVGVGTLPSQNIEALNQQYYTQCLQKMINAIEDLLDDGLGLLKLGYRSEFDLEDLLRMDTETRIKAITEAIKGSLMAINEGRKKFGYKPLPGGDSVYMQQQNYSLEALVKRDSKADPFAKDSAGTGTNPPSTIAEPDDVPSVTEAKDLLDYIRKGLECTMT